MAAAGAKRALLAAVCALGGAAGVAGTPVGLPARATRVVVLARAPADTLGGAGRRGRAGLGAGGEVDAQLQALGVDIDRALDAAPGLAELDPRDLAASLAFLARYVGEPRLVPFIASHPHALLWSAGEIERLLRHELGASDAQLMRMLRDAPFLLAPRVARRAARVVAFLRAELQLGSPDLLRAALAFPRLLTLRVGAHDADEAEAEADAAAALTHEGLPDEGKSSSSGLRERVRFLCDAAAVETAVVALAVRRHPQLLGLDVATSLRPKVAFLRAEGIDVGRLLALHPQALSLSALDNLAPKLAYWRSAGVPDVGAMVSSQPILASLSLRANIAPKTEYLRALGVADLGRALQAYPQVYTLALDTNIIPTVCFLDLCGYNIRAELRLRHLAASLARRIAPRHELWRRRRAHLGGWRPSVADVCVLGSAAFCERVGATAAELVEVEAAVGPIVRELSSIDPRGLAAAFGADEPAIVAAADEAEGARTRVAAPPPQRRRQRRTRAELEVSRGANAVLPESSAGERGRGGGGSRSLPGQ